MATPRISTARQDKAVYGPLSESPAWGRRVDVSTDSPAAGTAPPDYLRFSSTQATATELPRSPVPGPPSRAAVGVPIASLGCSPLHWTTPAAPAGELLAYMMGGYCDPDRQHIEGICRRMLPAVLGHFFPHPATPSVDALAAMRALAFVLDQCEVEAPTALQACFAELRIAVETASKVAAWCEEREPTNPLLRDQILLPPIAAGEPVMLEVGYITEPAEGSHAVVMLILPDGTGKSLCIVGDRGGDTGFHPCDAHQRLLPLVYSVATANLTASEPMAPLWLELLAMQSPDASHSLAGFYDWLSRFATAAGARDVTLERVVPAQSAQKTQTTCTIHSALAVVEVALHARFGTLEPAAPASQRARIHNYYKEFKDHARGVVLAQALSAWHDASPNDKPALADALTRTGAFLQEHGARKPALRAHLATLLAAGVR